MKKFEKALECDLCVIGGGMSGVAAAVSAAREGLKVVLVQDRTVLGGNASGEVRMWIRGAASNFPEYREGGIVEELALDNMHFNPKMNWSIWDLVLLSKVRAEKNITLLLSATCCGARQEGGSIRSVTVWKTDEYAFYEIKAKLYADCSGDSILAEFTDAEIVSGRESRKQYDEPMAREEADDTTMGSSVLIEYRPMQKGEPCDCAFVPLADEKFNDALKRRLPDARVNVHTENFWWLELRGQNDALRDGGALAEELVSLAASAHAFVRENVNREGYALEWIGSLAAKRETRRYVGDYVLTANDVLAGRVFDDAIAYGGWWIDDHYTDGIYSALPSVMYEFEKPYTIPYGCIYSKNVENLLFAGRNISVTHLALSSTRVMATCALLGQAVGFAAVVALKHGVSPRGAAKYVSEIQGLLRLHDCYLPGVERKKTLDFPDAERNIGGENAVTVLKLGESVTFDVEKKRYRAVRLVFDSDFLRTDIPDCPEREKLSKFPMLSHDAQGSVTVGTPSTLVSDFTLVLHGESDKTVEIKGNYQRLVFVGVNEEISGVTFRADKTHGCETARIFSIDLVE